MTIDPGPTNLSDNLTEFQVAEQVTALLDNISKEKQEQVMALLAKRYGIQLKEPYQPKRGRGFAPKRRY